ncbi:MAG TPA: hypothetical protein DDY31_19435 [Lachnospiraceae bacterium]|nr:hypothetical protein [Lachnospiraceae bacterium]
MIKNNKFLVLFLCSVLCMISVFSVTVNVSAATEKSDGRNMKKVLYYYGKKEYKTARKYNKKISKVAKESCVANMTPRIKKAYKNVVNRYKLFDVNLSSQKHIWAYYLTDIDNDRKVDLLVKAGSCEADVKLYIYQYKNGKAKKIGAVDAFHTYYYAYPNHKGILGYGGMMGKEWIRLITVSNGKLKEKQIGSRGIKKHWFNLRCELNGHISYNDYTEEYEVDYKDLL